MAFVEFHDVGKTYHMGEVAINALHDASFEIEKGELVVIVGPSGAGKSTIAKMISFCLWIEKKVATTLTEKIFSSAGDFVTTAEMYHKMHNYFNDSTVVRYESDVISINYAKDTLTIKLLDKFIYKRKKIVYMPSDRNLVAMPELEKLTLTNKTNLQSFTFDWLNARNTFDKSHKLNLLDLDMQYYYDSTEQIYKDKIVHSNGKTYDISLYDASSGLQSITFESTSNLLSIHDNAFSNCSQLTEISLPTSVNYIGKQAFASSALFAAHAGSLVASWKLSRG